VHLLRQIKDGTGKAPARTPSCAAREMRTARQVRSPKPVYMIAGQPVMNFRVLWVAKGAERKDGLRRLARDAGWSSGGSLPGSFLKVEMTSF